MGINLKLKDNANLTISQISYIPVDYIESYGAPNIDTGCSFWQTNNANQKIECTIEIFDADLSTQYIYYSVIQSRYAYLRCNNDADDFLIGVNLGRNSGTDPSTITLSGEVNIVQKYNTITVNGETFSIAFGGSYSNYANLFILPSGSGVRVRFKSFKFYSTGGGLLLNYIPVISLQEGHVGEACFYDKVKNSFVYAKSTGGFIPGGLTDFVGKANSVFIKDCPNIQGLNLIRRCLTATRVRLDIGNVSGSIEELLSYSNLNGFNDNYESQVKPRLIGTWTINSYHTIAEREAAEALFDGLTVLSDSNYLVDDLIEQDVFAIQTLDPDKPNYNPAAAILLNSKGTAINKWHTLSTPLISEGGRWLITKTDAATIGGVGTIFRGETTVIDTEGIVSSDTTAEYDFESFEELQYFGVTTIGAGTSTTVLGAFGGCTKLKKIILPETVTTIGAYGFFNCNKLESINIPSGLTANISEYAFYSCISIIDFDSPRGASITAFRGTSKTATYQFGCGTGIFIIHGSLSTTSIYPTKMYFKKILATDFSWNVSNALTVLAGTIVRISGTITDLVGNNNNGFTNGVSFLEFTTLSLTSAANNRLFASGGTQEVFIRRADLLPTGTPTNFGSGTVTKFYVGLGQNKNDDDATLQLYLNDTNWGIVSTKLDTWYNYNGQYKWYYVTAALSNCTSTNPDSWYTHPTRGESYHTTIEPDEGLTLSSVQVQMLDTDTTSPTYDTLVNITSSVYDSSTGEINIPSVTGNVVITAVAN